MDSAGLAEAGTRSVSGTARAAARRHLMLLMLFFVVSCLVFRIVVAVRFDSMLAFRFPAKFAAVSLLDFMIEAFGPLDFFIAVDIAGSFRFQPEATIAPFCR